MRTAHAPHRPRGPHSARARTVDIPKAERPSRPGMTVPGLAGGIVGAFLGIILGYAVGVAVMWTLSGRNPNGIVPPLTLWETLLHPGENALYTPLTIPLGFLLGGFAGEKIGRRLKRARKAP